MILYLPNELIPVQVGDVVFKVQQLTAHQKAVVHLLSVKAHKGDNVALAESLLKVIKYSVKAVEGVKLSNGKTYNVSYEEGTNVLTDDCVQEILCLPVSDKLGALCFGLINGVTDPLTTMDGTPIEGVKIISEESTPAKKPRRVKAPTSL